MDFKSREYEDNYKFRLYGLRMGSISGQKNLTVNDLVGTWQIEYSNEKYSFKADGNVLYIVGESSR